MQCYAFCKMVEIKGKPVSGRTWKSTTIKCAGALCMADSHRRSSSKTAVRPLHKSWEEKEKARKNKAMLTAYQKEVRERAAEEKKVN